MNRPSPTHVARFHLQVVNQPLVVEFPLFGVDRLRVDVNLAVVLGVDNNPVKVSPEKQTFIGWNTLPYFIRFNRIKKGVNNETFSASTFP